MSVPHNVLDFCKMSRVLDRYKTNDKAGAVKQVTLGVSE